MAKNEIRETLSRRYWHELLVMLAKRARRSDHADIAVALAQLAQQVKP